MAVAIGAVALRHEDDIPVESDLGETAPRRLGRPPDTLPTERRQRRLDAREADDAPVRERQEIAGGDRRDMGHFGARDNRQKEEQEGGRHLPQKTRWSGRRVGAVGGS